MTTPKRWEYWKKSGGVSALLPGLSGTFNGGGSLPGLLVSERRPKVRTEVRPGDSPAGGLLDTDSQAGAALALPGDGPVDLGISSADPSLKLGDGERKAAPEVHALKGSTDTVIIKTKNQYSQCGSNNHTFTVSGDSVIVTARAAWISNPGTAFEKPMEFQKGSRKYSDIQNSIERAKVILEHSK